jgi:hypothetical protein
MSVFLAACLSACAAMSNHETDHQRLARYLDYAGPPIHEFRFYSSFNSFSPLDRDHVLVSTGANQQYLLRVVPACLDLPFANGIGLTSSFHTVRSGFDSVRVGHDVCRITEIRPIDSRQMREDERAG